MCDVCILSIISYDKIISTLLTLYRYKFINLPVNYMYMYIKPTTINCVC